ncbi:MAG TPA: putative glycoside hydrolase [Ruminococcus sp.]|nr:putative glycoside hydrolase [Ruminococcus sp.]
MRQKNKGRKIYKTKEKNYYGKSPVAKFFSTGLTVLLFGGIVFIGYSVAEPIINHTKKAGDKISSALNTSEDIQEVTEAATDETSDEPSGADQNTAAANKQTFELYRAYALRTNDMVNTASVKDALSRIQKSSEVEYVEVPLKAKGGYIYYASSVYDTYLADAVQSTITLDEIVTAIKNAGYKPAAVVSTFRDNILPLTFPDTGYKTYDFGEMWIDDDYDAGGKPWTTPYSSAVQNYLSAIVGEISEAGFERVICSDFVFPQFRQTDLDLLDPALSRSDRYMALTSAANLMYDKIMSSGSRMLIEVSAADVICGRADVLQPMLLTANTVVVNIDIDEISHGVSDGWTVYEFEGNASDMTVKMLDFIGDKLDDFNVIIRISGTSVPTEDLIKAKDELAAHGYQSYVIG